MTEFCLDFTGQHTCVFVFDTTSLWHEIIATKLSGHSRVHKGSFSTQRCEIVIVAHTQFHILTEVKKKKTHKDEQENSLTSFKEHQKI